MKIYSSVISTKSLFPCAFFEFGQSNMFGYHPGVFPLTKYQQDFSNVDFEGEPMHFELNYQGDPWGFDLAFAYEFSRNYPESQVYVEKVAVHGTDLPYWLTPVNLDSLKTGYGNLTTRTNGIPNLKKILLVNQGETCATDLTNANNWGNNFTTIINELESTHGEFDYIIVSILKDVIPHASILYESIVRQQQIEWVNSNSKAIAWDMTPYTFFDGVHYDFSKYQMGKDLLKIYSMLLNH